MSNTKGLRRRTRSKFQRGFRQNGAIRNNYFDTINVSFTLLKVKKLTRYLFLM